MKHIALCLRYAARHPTIALLGAREFRSGFGMTYEDAARSEAYDAGRELAHIATGRHYDEARTT
jgi:hypothetical protein